MAFLEAESACKHPSTGPRTLPQTLAEWERRAGGRRRGAGCSDVDRVCAKALAAVGHHDRIAAGPGTRLWVILGMLVVPCAGDRVN